MKPRIILAALASSALLAAGPALAQGRGGGHGGGHGGSQGGGHGGVGVGVGGGGHVGMGRDHGVTTRTDARVNARARDRAAERARERANENSVLTDEEAAAAARVRAQARTDGRLRRGEARVNSRGPANASDRALSRANENSVLFGTRAGGALSGLATGMVVRDSAGMTIGTVSRINRSGDGSVRNVLVATEGGGRRIIPLAPETLTVSGDAVITTRLTNRRR